MQCIKVFFLTLGIISFPLLAQAASVDELKQQQSQLQQQVQKLHQQAQAEQDVAAKANEKVQEVNTQIDYLNTSIQTTSQQIQDTQAAIEQKRQEEDQLTSQLQNIQKRQDKLVAEIWIQYRSLPDSLAIFSSESVTDASKRQEQFKVLKKTLTTVYAKTNNAKLAVNQAKSELEKKNNDLKNYQTQQQEQQNGLADVQQVQQQLAQDAQAAVADLDAKERAARIKEKDIEAQVNAAVAAAIASQTHRSGGGSIGNISGRHVHQGDIIGHEGSTGFSTGPHVHFEVRSGGTPVNPAPYIGGTFIWPLTDFVISQGFGYTETARSGFYGGAPHTGIDLAGPYGEPVMAAGDGVIILNQYFGGYGNAVAIQHANGLVTLYGHMTGN